MVVLYKKNKNKFMVIICGQRVELHINRPDMTPFGHPFGMSISHSKHTAQPGKLWPSLYLILLRPPRGNHIC